MTKISINFNLASLNAERRLTDASSSLAENFRRLSSGLRVNKASDDAAGLSVATDLKVEARIKSQTIRNLNDGVSAISIYSEALNQLSDIATRLSEISEQAANQTLGISQRNAIQKEHTALVSEYNRIIKTVSFNDINLGQIIDNPIQMSIGKEFIGIEFGKELSRTVADGTYQDPTFFASNEINHFVISDTDGDGINKIYSATDNGIEIHSINLDGSLTYETTIGIDDYENLLTADFNGDGFDDILAKNSTTHNNELYLGGASGSLSLSDTIVSDNSMPQLLISSNGNVNFVDSSGIYAVSEQGQISKTANLSLNYAFSSGDFNSDGILDFVYAQDGIGLWLATGKQGGEYDQTLLVSGGSIFNIYAKDFDADGLLDIGYHSNDDFYIHYQNDNNSFDERVSAFSSLSYPSIALPNFNVVDLNEDGLLDILGGNDTGMRIYMQTSERNFEELSTPYPTVSGIDFPMAIDLNGDGALDIVAAGAEPEGFVTYISNTTKTNQIAYQDLKTRNGALVALDEAKETIQRVSQEKAYIGSVESRLGFAISSLQTETLNYNEAASRILDVDIGEESARLAKNQILQQVASQILRLSNFQPEIVKKLLEY